MNSESTLLRIAELPIIFNDTVEHDLFTPDEESMDKSIEQFHIRFEVQNVSHQQSYHQMVFQWTMIDLTDSTNVMDSGKIEPYYDF